MLLSLDLFRTSVRGSRIGVPRWLQCYMVLVVSNSVTQSVSQTVSQSISWLVSQTVRQSDSQSVSQSVSQTVSQSVSQSVSSGSLYALVVALHLLLCKNQDNCSIYVIANYSGALLRYSNYSRSFLDRDTLRYVDSSRSTFGRLDKIFLNSCRIKTHSPHKNGR